MSKKSPKYILSLVLICAFVLGVIAYVFFRSRALIVGPEITIVEPASGTTFYEPLITITGIAKNTSAITLGGKPIFITPEGEFSEQLVLSHGYTIITMFGEDRFGKTTTESLELFLDQEPDPYIQVQEVVIKEEPDKPEEPEITN